MDSGLEAPAPRVARTREPRPGMTAWCAGSCWTHVRPQGRTRASLKTVVRLGVRETGALVPIDAGGNGPLAGQAGGQNEFRTRGRDLQIHNSHANPPGVRANEAGLIAASRRVCKEARPAPPSFRGAP